MCASRIKRLWTRCNDWIAEARLVVKAWVTKSLVPRCTRLFFTIRHAFAISEDMIKHGFLFLSFGLLLVTIEKVSEKSTWELMGISKWIPPSSDYLSVVWGWVLVGVSLVLMCVFLWLGRKRLLKKRVAFILVLFFLFSVLWLTPPLTSKSFIIVGAIFLVVSAVFIFAVFVKPLADKFEEFIERQFKPQYWMVFLLVNYVGWLKGMSSIPEGVCTFVVELVGWLGFAWILVIMFMMFRSVAQSGKR